MNDLEANLIPAGSHLREPSEVLLILTSMTYIQQERLLQLEIEYFEWDRRKLTKIANILLCVYLLLNIIVGLIAISVWNEEVPWFLAKIFLACLILSNRGAEYYIQKTEDLWWSRNRIATLRHRLRILRTLRHSWKILIPLI